jgi:naked cuticle
MQQVAEWIEKEHTIDKDGEKVIVQRHEHHHIHEHHHHHHYHHYHEA